MTYTRVWSQSCLDASQCQYERNGAWEHIYRYTRHVRMCVGIPRQTISQTICGCMRAPKLSLFCSCEHSLRSKKLRILSYRKKRAFYQENIGKSFPVLFEAEKNNDFMYGFTSNYVKVKTRYNESLINEIKMVTLKEIDRDGLFLIDFN